MYTVFEHYIEEYLQVMKKKDSLDNEYEYICVPSNGRNSQRYPSEIKNSRRIVRVLPLIE